MIQNLGNKKYKDRFANIGLVMCGGERRLFPYRGAALWLCQHCGKLDRTGPLLKKPESSQK